MDINSLISERGIRRLLHFTTSDGLLGMLRIGGLLPRNQLSKESCLDYIRRVGWPDRSRDRDWHGHINLSIERPNSYLLSKARKNHQNINWYYVELDPVLLTHPGVTFTTTNNAYSSVVQRGVGPAALAQLYLERVVEFESGTTISRHNNMLSAHPTSMQAEALYPGRIEISYVRAIYSEDFEGKWHADGLLEMFGPPMECTVAEEELF